MGPNGPKVAPLGPQKTVSRLVLHIPFNSFKVCFGYTRSKENTYKCMLYINIKMEIQMTKRANITSPSEMEVYHRDTRNIIVHKWPHEMI